MSDRPLLVALRGVQLGYRGVALFGGVDLEIRAGDSIGVAGPNGSGKTTLLRTIVGLLAPLAGRVERRETPRLRIAYVPQNESVDLAWPLTALQVVRMGTEPAGGLYARSPADSTERALAALARVGLEPMRRTLFRSLSGGQRQRVLLARALAADPELTILDEPTNNLDAASASEIASIVRDVSEHGTAVVMVSHAVEYLAAAVRRILYADTSRGMLCWLSPEETDKLRGAWAHDDEHGHAHQSRPPSGASPKEEAR